MTLIVVVIMTISAIVSICALVDQEDSRRSEEFDTFRHFLANQN